MILRTVYCNPEPFAGFNIILVGDFDQKRPVTRGSSLAQILVNNATEQSQACDSKDVAKMHAANIFGMFIKFQLQTNQRLDKDSTKLANLLERYLYFIDVLYYL